MRKPRTSYFAARNRRVTAVRKDGSSSTTWMIGVGEPGECRVSGVGHTHEADESGFSVEVSGTGEPGSRSSVVAVGL